MKIAVVMATLFALGCANASASSLKGKVERDEFLQTKYGFCHSTIPAGFQCTSGIGTPYCKVGLKMKDESISYFLLTAHYVQIADQKRGKQSRRQFSHKGITCTAENPHLKAVQNCKDTPLANCIQRRCQVAIEDKGGVGWYDGTVTITDLR